MAARVLRVFGITTTGIAFGAAYYNKQVAAKININVMNDDEYGPIKDAWNNKSWIKNGRRVVFAPFEQPTTWNTVINGDVIIEQQKLNEEMVQTIIAKFSGLEPFKEYHLAVFELDNPHDKNIIGPYDVNGFDDWFGDGVLLKADKNGVASYSDTQRYGFLLFRLLFKRSIKTIICI